MIERRTFLRGMGAAMALPFLDAMRPLGSLRAAEPAARIPRLAFLYVPNGIHMPDWTPEATGADFALPRTLEPLAPFRKDFCVLTGLTQDKARPHGDGPGDHARAAACFLTGTQPLKTAEAGIRAGTSADQVAAAKVGRLTRFPSLELGIDAGQQSGNCDSGYSCAYSSNISWRNESTPMAKEINPRLMFERLFGGGAKDENDKGRALRTHYRKSILDFVAEDAGRLRTRVGVDDRRKLDEYFAAVREIETRLERAERSQDGPARDIAKPTGVPKSLEEHIRLVLDMVVIAFQADLTRVVTFMFANEGSNRSYPFLEVPEGHHDLSHHGGDKKKHEKLGKINTFHVRQLAYLLGRLKATPEGDGTILDSAMIVHGSGIGDGNRHNHNDLPVLLAGGGAGTILPGRHIVYPKETPLNNLYLSLLDRIDSSTDALGDSTGRLSFLYGADRSF
jgi:hypothetical protein